MGDRRERVVLDLDKSPYSRSLAAAGAETEAFARKASSDIDRYSGRLGLAVNAVSALGSGLIPIGAVGVPAVAGLTQELGFAALAGGSLLVAVNGVGDAVKALEKARLNPTTANLEAAHAAMAKLGPDARAFVRAIQDFLPTLRQIRDAAGAGWFPGLTDSIDDLEVLAPKVESILKRVGEAGGQLLADGADSLTSDRWWPFLTFIQHEAPQAITDLGHTVGNLTHGLAEMWMAFSPLNRDFSDWLLRISDDFDTWATKLSATQGFEEFIDYIRTTGPQVAATLGALGDALLQILEAAAPLGGPTLRIIEALATALAKVADSDLGTPLLALASLTSAVKLLNGATRGLAGANGRSIVSKALGLEELQRAPGAFRAAAAAERELVAAQEALVAANVRAHAAQGLPAAGRQAAMDEYAAAQQRVVVATQKATEAEKAAIATRAAGRRELVRNGVLLGTLAVAASGVSDKVGLSNTAMGAMTGAIVGPWGAAVGGAVGLAMDLGNAFDGIPQGAVNVHDAIDQITAATKDQVLAGAVNVDQLEAQAQSAIKLAQVLGDTDLEKQARAALDHARAIKADAVEHEHFARATEKVRQQQVQFKRAMQEARKAALEQSQAQADSFNRLGAGLSDAKVSFDKWLKQLEHYAEALHNFRINAQRAADKGLRQGLIDALDHMGAAGALRMRQLANASKSEIDRANAAWAAGGREIEKYNAIHVPPKKLNIDGSSALSTLGRIQTAIAGIKDKTVTVRIASTGSAAAVARGYGPQDATPSADGSTVPRGGPYTDRYPYLLAPGEEVISNRHGQADQHRALLKAINAGRLADGGTIGKLYVPQGGYGGVHRVERVETGPRMIHIDLGQLGYAMVDVATGVADVRIAHHARREEEQARR